MPRLILLGAGGVILALAIALWRSNSSSTETVFDPKVKPPESGALCPWREPASDLKSLFPNATGYKAEIRILSGLRVELAERLGRMPTGDENALHVWRIHQGNAIVGSVLTRRVKGEHGAIELVLAVDAKERVRGLRLQRLREPEAIARGLQNPEWLRSFEGRGADSSWKLGHDIPQVPDEARDSAVAIIDGTRCSLILLAASHQALPSFKPATAPHH